MIKLDGNYLEGGGSIVRIALALSTITQKPFEVTDIRKGRENPGLKAQHMHGIKALEDLCGAKTECASLGSTHLKYTPGKVRGHTIAIDIGTAGSISLLLQSALLPSLFADTKVRFKISGGTEGKWAQPWDYFTEVFLPQVKRCCERIEARLIQRGYYPKGNGKVDIEIRPLYKLQDYNSFEEFWSFLKSLNLKFNLLEQGHLIQIKGISHASKDLEKAQVAERQANAARLELYKLNVPVQIRTEYQETLSTGSGITLWAIFSKDPLDIDEKNPIRLGSDALGERSKRAEVVGKEAAQKLIQETNSKAPVDPYLADQLIPLLALLGGCIRTSKITKHTLTNIYVVEQFLGKVFKVDEKQNIVETIF